MLVDIFDFDGVLVDSLDSHKKFYKDIARELGFKLDNEKIMDAISKENVNFYRNMGFSEEQFAFVRQEYEERFSDYDCKIFAGIPEMIDKLARKRSLGIISLNKIKHIEAFFSEYLPYFELVVSRDGKLSKADELKSIMKSFGAENCLFVGDTNWDLDDARKSGINFLAAKYGGWYNFSGYEGRVIESVAELQEVLVSRG